MIYPLNGDDNDKKTKSWFLVTLGDKNIRLALCSSDFWIIYHPNIFAYSKIPTTSMKTGFSGFLYHQNLLRTVEFQIFLLERISVREEAQYYYNYLYKYYVKNNLFHTLFIYLYFFALYMQITDFGWLFLCLVPSKSWLD